MVPLMSGSQHIQLPSPQQYEYEFPRQIGSVPVQRIDEEMLERTLDLLEAGVQQTSESEQDPTVCSGVHSKKYTQVELAGQPVLLELDFLLLSDRADDNEATDVRETDDPAELRTLAKDTETEDLLDSEGTELIFELTAELALDVFLHCNGHWVV